MFFLTDEPLKALKGSKVICFPKSYYKDEQNYQPKNKICKMDVSGTIYRQGRELGQV
jgi:hypothetical protein